jgi:hypothetical protein
MQLIKDSLKSANNTRHQKKKCFFKQLLYAMHTGNASHQYSTKISIPYIKLKTHDLPGNSSC